MKATVYQRIAPDFVSNATHMSDLRMVAIITTEKDVTALTACGNAFALTQSIDTPWVDRDGDELNVCQSDYLADHDAYRSTAVGDTIAVERDGEVLWFFVAPVGFERCLEPKPGLRAYLIDAVQQAVTEIEYAEGETSLEEMYKLIGCELVDVVHLDRHGTVAFVDDEGLLKEPQDFWLWDSFGHGAQSFAGNAVVLGTGPEGESVSPRMTLDEVKQHITFKRRGELAPAQYTPEMHFVRLN